MKTFASLAFVVLTSCGLAAPRTGEVVEPGVARAVFEARARGTDIVEVTVIFPSDDAGVPTPGPHPGIVFVQGGFVATTRYEWQARALARQGYVVAIPEHPLELAFFAMDTGLAARDVLVAREFVDAERIGVMGHSLGSVVTVKLALLGGFKAAVLEAGYPDTADAEKVPTLGIPTMSMAGELDCSAALSKVQEGWATLPSPSALVVLDGVTHYQFTDAQTEDEQRGCAPTSSLEDAHVKMEQALFGFFSSAFSDGSVGEPSLRLISGTTVETK
ncbi:MAG: alpha/beta hydrolase [Archangium sp.]